MSAPHDLGILELKDNYAHLIPCPMERIQGCPDIVSITTLNSLKTMGHNNFLEHANFHNEN